MQTEEVVVHEVQCDGMAWFSSFFESPLVRRVNRRIDIRIVRFWRSISEALIATGSGWPSTTNFSAYG